MTTGTPVSTNLYATVAQLKTRLGIADTTDDTLLGMVLSGVCRAIDNHCGQRFWRDAVATTKYYTAEDDDTLFIEPIVSVTTLATDDDGDRTYENTWAATDYDLMPFNAAAYDRPYTWLETTPDGDYEFPEGVRKGVKIIGVFGWPTVPPAVTEAALLWSERIYKRKDAPFGIASFPEAGEMRLLKEMDPDVITLLKPFVRLF